MRISSDKNDSDFWGRSFKAKPAVKVGDQLIEQGILEADDDAGFVVVIVPRVDFPTCMEDYERKRVEGAVKIVGERK
jgi:hypothetical protein